MLSLFTYKTPPNFAADFKEFYLNANVKQIKVLSTTLLIIAFLARVSTIFYYKKASYITSYTEHSFANWVHLTGAFIFFALSVIAIKSGKWTITQRKILTLFFVLFVLLITLGVSYTVSLHNTKNTLTMFLIGIVTVSLFFAIDYKEIIGISTFIVIVFILSMVVPKITFQDKLLNVFAAFILGFLLVAFSRYSYFFKSQHFVRLKRLEQQNIEIERLNIQKSDILAFVAHDLRTPLNNIEALSTLLNAENESEEAVMIANSAQQAKNIINDLLEAVKAEEPMLQTEVVNLVAFVQEVIGKWQSNAKRQISFSSNETAIFTKINTSKIERVIDNLLSNAIKFSPANFLVDVELAKHDTNICIIVKDYGIGIPEKLLDQIFTQFSSAGRRGLQGEKSVGLGLHISKKIIEQHQGKLLVSSKENEGTCFTILLPK